MLIVPWSYQSRQWEPDPCTSCCQHLQSDPKSCDLCLRSSHTHSVIQHHDHTCVSRTSDTEVLLTRPWWRGNLHSSREPCLRVCEGDWPQYKRRLRSLYWWRSWRDLSEAQCWGCCCRDPNISIHKICSTDFSLDSDIHYRQVRRQRTLQQVEFV